MEEQAQPKWRGKSSAEVNGHAAQEVWPLLADFCNLHKVFPKVETCYQLEGIAGQTGLVRYCAGFASNRDESTIKWAKERLLMIDPIKRCLSYEVIDSNMGFKSYVAIMHVVPINDDGSMIEWSFVCDPTEGRKMEDVQSFGESSLQSIAKKIEHVLTI
ncbi:putative polyketide cyclase/dehydrase, START-like domain-containing protein [Rosa chinensis]|uniref:Putative polyketide cyclase/dehydrase, START-like domain-containing protein n=1 Tax=Rosa chinensis TaxID=74649 RepID=A0A2P6Q083_ROSCH|nr:lachrymatory-factor synthase [Rosa chinensis]PRQ27549.1 putative polyketide cyclase/dehydrase, START-like domain-containing protein [Rosa chinensis]